MLNRFLKCHTSSLTLAILVDIKYDHIATLICISEVASN